MSKVTILQKPKRKDFTKMIVVQSNGSMADPAVVQGLVKDLPPGSRKIAKVLKKENLKHMDLFQEEEYEKAKNAYFAQLHDTQKAESAKMIQKICDEVGVTKTRHIDASLRALRPLFKNATPEVQHAAYKGIVQSISGAGVLKDFADRERQRTDKKASRKPRVRKTTARSTPAASTAGAPAVH